MLVSCLYGLLPDRKRCRNSPYLMCLTVCIFHVFDGENICSTRASSHRHLCAGDEEHSGRTEVARHEVVDGTTAVTGLSTTDPSHVYVGLCRATDRS